MVDLSLNIIIWRIICPGVQKLSWRPCINGLNRICGVKVNLLALSAVDREFEPRSGQTKDRNIGICCLSKSKHCWLGIRIMCPSRATHNVRKCRFTPLSTIFQLYNGGLERRTKTLSLKVMELGQL